MREMHKWKDKVELSLDNRQIFFLFFGLSVVGCFVFALGVMVGQKVNWQVDGEAVSTADSLALLDGTAPLPEIEPADLTFKQGLQEPATAELPQTRDPATLTSDGQAAPAANAKATAHTPETKQTAPAPTRSPASASKAKDEKPAAAAAMAAVDSAAVTAAPDKRSFTLQMKAFAREEDATKLAGELRAKGHDVRVEPHEVRGRMWYRVRLGHYRQWDEAIAAKATFEKAERVIAYVVRDP